tara:strand:- start:29480 stop:29593 length:114 start_codon:yes stop_codon:yes gene_type:complete
LVSGLNWIALLTLSLPTRAVSIISEMVVFHKCGIIND